MQSTNRYSGALPGETREQRKQNMNTFEPQTSKTRQGRKTKDSVTRKTAHRQNDTRKIALTPQAILPKQMRQAYLDCNSTLLKLKENNINKAKTETFGNPIGEKDHDTVRLIGQNIGCLGVRSFGNQKQEQGKD